MVTYISGNKPQSEMTANPSKYPQGYFKEKCCKECGSIFKPEAPSHSYCSQKCVDIGTTSAYLKRNYNIDSKEYNRLYHNQNGLCAICNGPGFTMAKQHKVKLVVDHCHTTGIIRGLLCHNCNRALGLLKDDIDAIKNAINYLESATTIPLGSTLQANGNGSGEHLVYLG